MFINILYIQIIFYRSCGIYASLLVRCHQHWWLTMEPTQDIKKKRHLTLFSTARAFEHLSTAAAIMHETSWNYKIYAIINLRYCMHVCKNRHRLMQQKLMNWGVHVNVACFIRSSAICTNLTISAWLILVESSRVKADLKRMQHHIFVLNLLYNQGGISHKEGLQFDSLYIYSHFKVRNSLERNLSASPRAHASLQESYALSMSLMQLCKAGMHLGNSMGSAQIRRYRCESRIRNYIWLYIWWWNF